MIFQRAGLNVVFLGIGAQCGCERLVPVPALLRYPNGAVEPDPTPPLRRRLERSLESRFHAVATWRSGRRRRRLHRCRCRPCVRVYVRLTSLAFRARV
jgi:hypothetical protein